MAKSIPLGEPGKRPRSWPDGPPEPRAPHSPVPGADGTKSAAPERRANRRRTQWIGLGVILAIALVLLGVAETTWLHELPQDQVTRITLAVFPKAPGSETIDWQDALIHTTMEPTLLEAIVADLDLRDASTNQHLSVAALQSRLYSTSQCIQQDGARGVLLALVVRGTSESETERIARTWAQLIVTRSAAAFPDLVIQPVETLGVPYEICQ